MLDRGKGGKVTTQLLESRGPASNGGNRRVNRDAHSEVLRALLSEADASVRARRATEELQRLEDERTNLTAIRDAAIYRLANTEGHSYNMVGAATGLTKERAAQLVRRANEVHVTAARHVARLKRQLRAP